MFPISTDLCTMFWIANKACKASCSFRMYFFSILLLSISCSCFSWQLAVGPPANQNYSVWWIVAKWLPFMIRYCNCVHIQIDTDLCRQCRTPPRRWWRAWWRWGCRPCPRSGPLSSCTPPHCPWTGHIIDNMITNAIYTNDTLTCLTSAMFWVPSLSFRWSFPLHLTPEMMVKS